MKHVFVELPLMTSYMQKTAIGKRWVNLEHVTSMDDAGDSMLVKLINGDILTCSITMPQVIRSIGPGNARFLRMLPTADNELDLFPGEGDLES